MNRALLLLLLSLPFLSCSWVLPFAGDEGRPCQSGSCKVGYRCVNNICQSVDGGVPDDGTGLSFTGHLATLSSASPVTTYEVVDDGFEFTVAMCSGELCSIGGFIQ